MKRVKVFQLISVKGEGVNGRGYWKKSEAYVLGTIHGFGQYSDGSEAWPVAIVETDDGKFDSYELERIQTYVPETKHHGV